MLQVPMFESKTSKIRRNFSQLSNLIVNIAEPDRQEENWISYTPPTWMYEIELVNFGPQTKKL